MSELKGLAFSRYSSEGVLFPLIGDELRALFTARITADLANLGVHLYCQRCPIQAEALRQELSQTLAFFLECYLPLIIAANLLCAVEEDWANDLKLMWQDLEALMAGWISDRQKNSAPDLPPRAIDRIKSLDHRDPIGSIMLTEFEKLFPLVLKEQSQHFIST